jgi:hypothetical protein
MRQKGDCCVFPDFRLRYRYREGFILRVPSDRHIGLEQKLANGGCSAVL